MNWEPSRRTKSALEILMKEPTLDDLWNERYKELQKDSMYADIYEGIQIAFFAIKSNYYLGPTLAWRSGCQHRLTRDHWAWRMVHSAKLTVATDTWNDYQPIPMEVAEAVDMIKEPSYLGCTPRAIYDEVQIRWPETALFLYPENYGLPNETRNLVDWIVKNKVSEKVYIITKEPLILTDAINTAILLL